MCVVKYVDKFGYTGIFCLPQIYGGEHGDNVGMLKPTTVSDKKVEKIPWGSAGVEVFQVLETPEPCLFDDF